MKIRYEKLWKLLIDIDIWDVADIPEIVPDETE